MPKSEPVEMTAFYKGTVYECDYGRCKDDEGNPIWPGYKESWDVDLTALAPRATAALLAAQPLIVAVRDAARAAIVDGRCSRARASARGTRHA